MDRRKRGLMMVVGGMIAMHPFGHSRAGHEMIFSGPTLIKTHGVRCLMAHSVKSKAVGQLRHDLLGSLRAVHTPKGKVTRFHIPDLDLSPDGSTKDHEKIYAPKTR